VNGENILQLSRDELPDLFDDVDLRTRLDMWVQLDGAGTRCARIVTTFLNNRFNARWIGWNGPVHWPPRSPDLTPLDFFLWGYLKNVVYEQEPTTRDMIERIRIACSNIPRAMLLKTVRNFRKRIQSRIEVDTQSVSK